MHRTGPSRSSCLVRCRSATGASPGATVRHPDSRSLPTSGAVDLTPLLLARPARAV